MSKEDRSASMSKTQIAEKVDHEVSTAAPAEAESKKRTTDDATSEKVRCHVILGVPKGTTSCCHTYHIHILSSSLILNIHAQYIMPD